MKTLFALLLTALAAFPASSQERAWLQIEAKPTRGAAEQRARAYSGAFDNVAGFATGSEWYAVALGPYAPDTARQELRRLRRAGRIPADSYVVDGARFRRRFWPAGTAADVPTEAPRELAQADQAERTTRTDAAPEPARQTPAEARRAERRLSRAERKTLQEALAWEGYYTGAVDAAIGPGTRRAMRALQRDRGDPATGVLTARQRRALVEGYRSAIASLGLRRVTDDRAGIEITLPMGMVEFDRTAPPFVKYASTGGSGVRVMLISQRGDRDTLYGLYDIMQTLEIVPAEGKRQRRASFFLLTGESDELASYSYARLTDGTVKGFTLIWRPDKDRLMRHTASVMRESFRPVAGEVLPDSAGPAGEERRRDMLSGLEIRRPDRSRSGFYVNGAGAVLTTTGLLGDCDRVTLGDEQPVAITATEPRLGLAVLTPPERLSPVRHARFRRDAARIGSGIAVAGFSYGDVLNRPVLTFGRLADSRGLDGETALSRLEVETMPDDAGGPVLDDAGRVLGMLQAREEGGPRQLPENVHFAVDAAAITAFLAESGVATGVADRPGGMAPEDLTDLAADMTVRVSCWK